MNANSNSNSNNSNSNSNVMANPGGMPIKYVVTSKTVWEMIEGLKDDTVFLPEHQRGYVWNEKMKKELIDHILAGLPITTIILRETPRGLSIEDGSQRIRTMKMFMEDTFTSGSGQVFSQLDPRVQSRLSHYAMPTLVYSGGSQSDVIKIFNRFQNGSSLKMGERLHSMRTLSPVVKTAVDLLLTPGTPLYARVSQVFGARGDDLSKGRYKSLTNATALIAGIAFGSVYMSKTWSLIEGVLDKTDIKTDRIRADLDFILSIYEAVDQRVRIVNKTQQNRDWDLGNGVGYIVHSLNTADSHGLSRDDLHHRWVDFLTASRRDKGILDTVLFRRRGAARNWTPSRWANGFSDVFAEKLGQPLTHVIDVDDDDTEDQDDD